jgi:alanine dehydrogenase
MGFGQLFNASSTLRLGLIQEGKAPADRRVALTPHQAEHLQSQLEGDLDLWVETSEVRCFADADYRRHGLPVVMPNQMKEADVLMGIKEVPLSRLIEGKTYFFFSHTTKKQPANRRLLQAILDLNIRLIDYEHLLDENGRRLIGFGVFAGNVGAHYALMMIGRRRGAFRLPPASHWMWKSELLQAYGQLHLPPERIVVTGRGRVSQGAVEVLNAAGVYHVKPESFLQDDYDMPVYTILDINHLYRHPRGGPFSTDAFMAQPEAYASNFDAFARRATVLINGMFWEQRSPQLFQPEDVQDDRFAIDIIADITCDVGGSVPITLRESSSNAPVYGVDRRRLEETEPYQNGAIDIMAISNLPNELAPDASQAFGKVVSSRIVPACVYEPESEMLQRATIARKGRLTEHFAFLEDYVQGLV